MADPIILTRTQVIKDRDGPPKVGANYRTRYIWRGPADQPVFAIRDSRDVEFERIDVVCETPCEAVFLVERTKTGGGTIPPTMNQWRNVRVYGNGLAAVGYDYRATIDENNEHGRFDCCSVYGCAFGWRFSGQQSKEHLLTHCRYESGFTALSSDTGFQWIGGTVAVCETGIVLTRVGDPVLIQGVGFEACGRLLVTAGPTTDAQPIVLQSVRYAADQLHDDGAMIVLRHAGPLTILGGSYGDGAQRVPQIECAGIGEQAVTVMGAKRGAVGSVAVPFVRTMPGVRLAYLEQGCTYENAAGAAEHTATRA